MKDFENDFLRAEFFQNLIIDLGTYASGDLSDYEALRQYFMAKTETRSRLPPWIITNRDRGQVRAYIQHRFGHYAERREFIYGQFAPLLDYLEEGKAAVVNVVSEGLKSFDAIGVHSVWAKALERRQTDPEGSITASRSLLETVCKHILDEKGVDYDARTDLPELYGLVSKELDLSPSQSTEDLFKKILGGCITIVNGLGAIRNRFGDAHGQSKNAVKPALRHAELAVNLAGSMALFLVETWENRKIIIIE
jgi:hypothetical protein